jgi:VWFA-related protein
MTDVRPARSRVRRALAGVICASAAATVLVFAQQVTFRSTVELVAVDTQVIDRDGTPIDNLASKDFQVWINGQPRKVVSADRITYPLAQPRTLLPTLFDEPTTVHADVPEVKGRVFVVVVDELSFSTEALPAVMETARKFVATLHPEDVVGLYAYPFGPPRLDLSHYHNTIGVQLTRLQGLRQDFGAEFVMSPSEAIDIAVNDVFAFNSVFQRECMIKDRTNNCVVPDLNCASRLRAEANAYVDYIESTSSASFGGLRDLLHGLAGITGPKTVILLSSGLTTSDRVGARPDVSSMMAVAGKYAAAANAVVYAVHIDSSLSETYSSNAPKTHSPECQERSSDMYMSQARDGQLRAFGLERVAAETGGGYFRVTAGTGELSLNRILKETSSYYLLGVQPESADRDGRVHFIRVKTGAKNATVRARQQVTIPRGGR